MSSIDNVTITARCHCSSFNQSVILPKSGFPLKSALCHCNSCRRATGWLFATFAVIPLPVPEQDFFKNLVKYESSPSLSRYFCSKCGANVCNVEKDEWELATGVLEIKGGLDGKLDRGLLFIGDAGDGGAVPWINNGKAEGLRCRKMGARNSQDVTDGMLAALEKLGQEKFLGQVNELEAKCHCQSVKYHILKPDGRDEQYGGGLCACTSCTKTTGFEITSWVRVPKAKIKAPDGSSLGPVLKGLGKYTSSAEVNRYFCKQCGATVFYDDTTRETMDVGVGLLNALEGSKVESLVEWNQDGDSVGFPEDALDKEFVSKLTEGVRRRTTWSK